MIRERTKEHLREIPERRMFENSLFTASTMDSPSRWPRFPQTGNARETLIHYVGRIGVRQNRLPVFDRGEIGSDISRDIKSTLSVCRFLSAYRADTNLAAIVDNLVSCRFLTSKINSQQIPHSRDFLYCH
mgnify:CR=1 FL=1